MDYLFSHLFWWLVLAFLIGLYVGWYSCGRETNKPSS